MASFATGIATNTRVAEIETVGIATQAFISVVLVAGLAGISTFFAFTILQEEAFLALKTVLRIQV